MSTSTLSKRDYERLKGVHPDLIQLVELAIHGEQKFFVIEGLRTLEAQRLNVQRGASLTMNSKHLRQHDGYGHAVDLGPIPLDWNDTEAFRRVAAQMMEAASRSGVKIRWGGTFRRRDGRPWFDGPHYELM